jgi:thiamine-phosphate pyrophosphorylase
MPSPLSHERDLLRRYAARLRSQRQLCRVPSLVLLTDDDRSVDWIDAVMALPSGSAVIVRARSPERRKALALATIRIGKPRRILILIADDIKLAIRIRADGVHFPERNAWKITSLRRCNPNARVTMSAHSARGVAAASRLAANAVFLSPIFQTVSHPNTMALGATRWAMLARTSRIPVFSLGGLNPSNVKAAIASGARGLGVIGSWITTDPKS